MPVPKVAERRGVERFLQLLHRRGVTIVLSDHQLPPRRCGLLDHSPGGTQATGDRLFTEHVQAVLERQRSVLGVDLLAG